MFKKILVAEDIDSISLGIKSLQEDFNTTEFVFSKYCEDAFLKIRKALIDNAPFDLLITDLSFKYSNVDTQLTDGVKLIEAVREAGIPIAVVVYSIEERGHRVRHLFNKLEIDGFVSKGRNSIAELQRGIKKVYENEKYISPDIAHLKSSSELTEIDNHDLEILQLLSEGLKQPEIEKDLQKKGKKASSISSVEKRIIKMKALLDAKNTTHLVSIAKDMGLL